MTDTSNLPPRLAEMHRKLQDGGVIKKKAEWPSKPQLPGSAPPAIPSRIIRNS